MDERKLIERMLRENEEFRKTYEDHQGHEQELAKIKERNYLTDAERLQEIELKKKKLALKDKMYQMMREFSRSL